MSKNKEKKIWYDIPPVELVEKVTKHKWMHPEVGKDLLELYKRDKNVANGIMNQIDLYVTQLLPDQVIKRIEISNSDFGYNVKYVSDEGVNNTLEMELCMGNSPCKTLGNIE